MHNNTENVQNRQKQPEVSTKWFLILHLSLVLNSLSGAAAKASAGHDLFSVRGMFFFGLEFLIMASFAVIWQQVLKHMTLNFAFINKPITVLYPLVWGALFFSEKVTPRMFLGAVIILIGIVVGVSGHE